MTHSMETTHDLVILGGGPAGMTAAIYAAKANLRAVVLEKNICGGLVNSTYQVENYPSYPRIAGMELMEKFKSHAQECGVDIHEVLEIESVGLKGPIKTAVTDEGTFSAPAIILATGRQPKKLPPEFEDDHIHYCAICDGSAYKDQCVLVVGGGNAGVEESLYMKSLGVRRIVLIEQLDFLPAGEKAAAELVSRPDVEVLTSTSLQKIHTCEDGMVAVSLCRNGEILEREAAGIFVYVGQDPQTEMFKDSLKLDEYGYIPADADMKTELPGVFAAGDTIRKKYRQITTAVNDGTIAALSAVAFLRNHR